jgi:hypothetical protein
VEQTQCVENRMELAHVLASQIMWVIHMRAVVQNVSSTQTVLLTVPVYETSVRILVQELVARMQTVKLWITYHLAHVAQASLEIHSYSAITYLLNVSSYNWANPLYLINFCGKYIILHWYRNMKYHVVILSFPFLLFFSCTATTGRSLCTVSLWTKQSVSKCEWTRSLLLPTELLRHPTGLSARVCRQFGMSPEQSVCESKMRGPMPRNMWTECTLWSDQPQSNL